MIAASLFAGIGGFDLGLQRAGVRAAWQVEQNPASQRVLARHFPDAQPHDDVRTFADGSTQPVHADLVCGGFPCQDVSVAGRRAGLAGERSGLFFEFMRIVQRVAPRWVLIENVPGLLSSHHGRDMLTVLSTLAELGYGTAYRVLDAQWLGVAQQRRRVFVVGCAGADWRRAAEVLFERESLPWDSPPSREAGADVARSLTARPTGGGFGGDADTETLIPFNPAQITSEHNRNNPAPGAPCPSIAADGHPPAVAYRTTGNDGCYELGDRTGALNTGTDRTQHVVAYQCHGSNVGAMGTLRTGHNEAGGVPFLTESSQVRRLTPRECERLQGFPDDWTAGESDTARYRMLGNAVAVPVAEWIARRIVDNN